jgi:DNA-binding protein YbaB
MDVLNQLKEYMHGDSLGVAGVDLQNFIKEQQAIQRDERQSERELDKQRLNAEDEGKKVKVELERDTLT